MSVGGAACTEGAHAGECFSAPRRGKSGEPGREEQASAMNYSWRLRTTRPRAEGGMDDAEDEEQMTAGVKVWEGSLGRRKGDERGTCHNEQPAC